MKRFLLVLLMTLAALALFAERLKIDFRYNLNGDDGKNHLNWQNGTKKVRDSFDAVSGASKKMSTKLLRELQTVEKKRIFPKGLYALLLFAVTSPEQAKEDLLSVEKNDNMLTISFVHRGNAYRITTDEKGRFDLLTGFSIAEGLATNTNRVFTIKPEFIQGYQMPAENPDEKAEAAKNVQGATDWNLVDWEKVTFIPDTYDETAEKIWSGRLKADVRDGILTVSGGLKKIDKPKKAEAAEADNTEPEKPDAEKEESLSPPEAPAPDEKEPPKQ